MTGREVLVVVVNDVDLFNNFSGEEADFSTAEVERRIVVVGFNGDLAVVAEEVPFTFGFIVNVVGFGGALKNLIIFLD